MGVSIDITERKQAEEALRERLQFEHLLSGLSARFVNMPTSQVEAGIEDGLRQILEFFQVDRCALLRLLLAKSSFQITHIATSDNVPPIPERVELSRSIYPWTYEKLAEKNEMLVISRLDDLPAEANTDRQTCIQWGIGFDWAEVKENPGLGFSSMRERVKLIHGEFSITTKTPGTGVCLAANR